MCAHVLSAEALISGEKQKYPQVIASKKTDRFECPISGACDYDHSPHKMTTVQRTATMITVLIKMLYFWGLRWWSQPSSHNDRSLFLRIAIMIAILIKCTIYEDCDHDHNPHKNVIFLSLYMTAIMIVVLFYRIAIMIAVFTIMFYTWVFMRIATKVTILTKCPNFEFLWELRPWSQSSQNALFLSLTDDYDHESNPHISIVIINSPSSTNIE